MIDDEGFNLTGKQRKFCEEWVKDFNGTRAALAAGYSPKTAYDSAYDNTKKPEIKRYIKHLQDNVAEQVGISQFTVLNRLKQIGTANITDGYDGNELKDFEDLPENLKTAISSVSIEPGMFGVKKSIRVHSPLQAMAQICKLLGWDKQPEGGQTPPTINIYTVPPPDYAG